MVVLHRESMAHVVFTRPTLCYSVSNNRHTSQPLASPGSFVPFSEVSSVSIAVVVYCKLCVIVISSNHHFHTQRGLALFKA